MHYPLSIRFKVVALASQLGVKDAEGNEQLYVKQKMFKLKENIEIFKDSSKSEELYTIKADKVIDFSPTYTLRDNNDIEIGAIKRQGRKSLWSATYELSIGGQQVATVKEANPWAKVLDALLGEVPFLGILSAFLLHPKYSVTSPTGIQLALLHKRPAFFEGKFELEDIQMSSLPEQQQYHTAALLMIVALLERMRG